MFSWQNKYCIRITFISDNRKYQNTGEAPGLIEPLDESVAKFLKRLIQQGTKNTKELQRRALEYVKESFFLSLVVGLDVIVFLVNIFLLSLMQGIEHLSDCLLFFQS